jgi:hypothetical protein
MSLCDSCTKWDGCEIIGPARDRFGKELPCDQHAPITRADLVARDAEIAGLKLQIDWKAPSAGEIVAVLDSAMDICVNQANEQLEAIREGAKP